MSEPGLDWPDWEWVVPTREMAAWVRELRPRERVRVDYECPPGGIYLMKVDPEDE